MRCSYRTKLQPIHFLPAGSFGQIGQQSDQAPMVLDRLLRLRAGLYKVEAQRGVGGGAGVVK
jgi:hypothetical protein